MFSTSSQRKHWTFSGETELSTLRKEANEAYVLKHGSNMGEDDRSRYYLTASEERIICRHYEHVLREFCKKFLPPMPKYVMGTAVCYFKRFYIHNSAMDYHPKDIMLTCVYLSCKVEEFNVSIGQFVGNLKGDREKFTNIILTFELLLMSKLHYHLTVYNPYRPLEGLFIDIKTRCKTVGDTERLRPSAESFLEKSFATDACLIFAPSQIALAAVLFSASKEKVSLDSYTTEVLLQGGSADEVKKTMYQIKRITYMVKTIEPLQSKDVMSNLQKKLEHCRDQENNPDSEAYKRKLQELLDEDEEVQTKKRKKIGEAEKKAEKELLGF